MLKQLLFVSSALLLADGARAACEFDVEVGDTMQYSTDVIEADASCEAITINLKHTGDLPAASMGHNWVLTRPEHLQDVAVEGMSMGMDNSYLPPGDQRVLAATEIIGGGESTSIEFSTADLDQSEYRYFCSFPGHWAVMQGTFKLV